MSQSGEHCHDCEAAVPSFFDEYGFLIPRGEDQDGAESRCHEYSAQPTLAIADSWSAVCETWSQHDKDSPHKLRQLLRKGLPRQQRSQVWQLFLNSTALKAQSTFNYQTHLSDLQSKLESLDITSHSNDINVRKLNQLVDKHIKQDQETRTAVAEVENLEGDGSSLVREDLLDPELVCWVRTTRQIMMDIMRTFPYHQLFLDNASPTRSSLLHILTLYSLNYNKSVGYCQGMAYVGALLLMNMSEEDAFWALVSLFERSKYLAGFYDNSLSKIKTHADVFGLMLKERFPQLSLHLDLLGIHPLVYVTPWFMCLFTTLPCWDTVLTICDLLFLEGINTIFRAALAIMEVCCPELLAMHQISDVIPFLQNIPSRLVSLKTFSRVLWKTTVHKWEVDLYQDMVLEGNMATRDDPGDSDGGQEGRSSERRAGRTKKRRVSWEGVDGGEDLPSLKRRRKDDSGATPTSSAAPAGQSLFSRLVNAITPAHLTKRPSKQLHESTPQLSSNNTPGTRNLISTSDRTAAAAKRSKFKTPSTRPRARPEHGGSKSSVAKVRLSANDDVAVGREKDIEMKDFSTSLQKRKNGLSTSFSTENSRSSRVKINTVTGIPNLRFDSRSPIPENCMPQITSCGCGLDYSPYVHTPGNHGDGDTPKQGTLEASSMTPTQRQPVVRRRRSVRIAKRRSMTQGGGVQGRPSPLVKEGAFPVPSVLSPRLERPLQDYVQSTAHPWDHHAFKSFSTPTPLRTIQVNDKGYHSVKRRSSRSGVLNVGSSSPIVPVASPASPWQQTTSVIDQALVYSPEVELQPLKI